MVMPSGDHMCQDLTDDHSYSRMLDNCMASALSLVSLSNPFLSLWATQCIYAKSPVPEEAVFLRAFLLGPSGSLRTKTEVILPSHFCTIETCNL